MHICTSNPKIIRTEVENMRDDFNNRLTQILFSSFFSAYYACFLPLVFVQVRYYFVNIHTIYDPKILGLICVVRINQP